MKKQLLLIVILMPHFLLAQDCTCSGQLEWLIKTFSENDAGFQYIIDQKGEEAYRQHNTSYREKVKSTSKITDCGPLLYQWTQFFRSGHVGIKLLSTSETLSNTLTDAEIIEKYNNTEKYLLSTDSLATLLDKLTIPGVEGIWQNGRYKIGIIKDIKNQHRDYVGFIITADSVYWKTSQIKLELFYGETNKLFNTNFFMQDHSANKLKTRLVGNNLLKTGDIFWKRVYPAYPNDKKAQLYFKTIITRKAYLQYINENTSLLRIPSFSRTNKKHIDSLLSANHELLTSTENLVIDVRNNGGGSDASYYNILPYLYTNPIQTVGVQYLSTPLNNSRMKQLIKDPDFSKANKIWFRKSLKKLNNNLGKFVNLDEKPVTARKFDQVFEYPAKVAILINEYCGSTTEEFLLAAKQSGKVKLFGKTTSGVLDISNQHFVKSPCGDIELVYCITKSNRIPDFAIDGVGIQPDFLQNETIKDEELIHFAIKMISDQ